MDTSVPVVHLRMFLDMLNQVEATKDAYQDWWKGPAQLPKLTGFSYAESKLAIILYKAIQEGITDKDSVGSFAEIKTLDIHGNITIGLEKDISKLSFPQIIFEPIKKDDEDTDKPPKEWIYLIKNN